MQPSSATSAAGFTQHELGALNWKLLKQWRWHVLGTVLVIICLNLWVWGLGRNDVLDVSYSFPNGGGYCSLADTGVLRTIKHNGSVILPASNGGSYCCGFTFQVAMQVAEQRGLLKNKSAEQVRQFQQEWYGSTKATALKECVAAMTNLGIGREVSFADARPGDFVTFQRDRGSGHSVIFLNWMKDREGRIIGLHYRSSQPDTGGVGDNFEYFSETGFATGGIRRDELFLGRLNRRWWSRLLYPFDF